MHCEEKYRLLNLHKAKVAATRAAVNDMTLARGSASQQEYAQLWATAEKAKADSEAASLTLFQHTQEHEC